jgi:hypothetical protein
MGIKHASVPLLPGTEGLSCKQHRCDQPGHHNIIQGVTTLQCHVPCMVPWCHLRPIEDRADASICLRWMRPPPSLAPRVVAGALLLVCAVAVLCGAAVYCVLVLCVVAVSAVCWWVVSAVRRWVFLWWSGLQAS